MRVEGLTLTDSGGDGIYLGGGEFPNAGLGAAAAVSGVTLTADANLSTNALLTIISQNTDWGDGPHDDGFFLFKIAPGDFSVSVQLITPYDNGAFNTAGVLARAFDAGGAPFTGAENYVSWARFNQFGIGSVLRNEINNNSGQVNNPDGLTDASNTNYWFRIDRSSLTNFGYAGVFTRDLFEAEVAVPNLDQPLAQGTDINLRISALIPDAYLPDVHNRLMLYKRISNAKDQAELDELQVEMIDRFGPLPTPTANLVRLIEIKRQAIEANIAKAKEGRITEKGT